ncbi:MAG TPA: RDD family protein [Chromatiaceae bacterium]|jgi:uncharacterized RDD family membrane protein YckC|nr:MAG: hypothetical protein N838_31630 [Thiohalocapsa sp. PB-PSB1]QQO53438.1 MAG: RDD family protein [Thiohalocapsa sp. PB-PSB1]HBG96216.1 RDD family protein [Chromatiaceae bacterium]HCS91084.1 RDD family protein [Chromatiaceae bacterium]
MTTNQTSTPLRAEALERARVPGLLRRLASILYDLMLVSSILVVAAALFVIPALLITGNAATEGPLQPGIGGIGRIALQVWLLAVLLAYYGYFWSQGRQTLAMRAWRIRLVRDDGAELSIADAMRRLLFAGVTLLPFGAGLLWVLFDPNGLAWYDRLSHTRPLLLAKPASNRNRNQGV